MYCICKVLNLDTIWMVCLFQILPIVYKCIKNNWSWFYYLKYTVHTCFWIHMFRLPEVITYYIDNFTCWKDRVAILASITSSKQLFHKYIVHTCFWRHIKLIIRLSEVNTVTVTIHIHWLELGLMWWKDWVAILASISSKQTKDSQKQSI